MKLALLLLRHGKVTEMLYVTCHTCNDNNEAKLL